MSKVAPEPEREHGFLGTAIGTAGSYAMGTAGTITHGLRNPGTAIGTAGSYAMGTAENVRSGLGALNPTGAIGTAGSYAMGTAGTISHGVVHAALNPGEGEARRYWPDGRDRRHQPTHAPTHPRTHGPARPPRHAANSATSLRSKSSSC